MSDKPGTSHDSSANPEPRRDQTIWDPDVEVMEEAECLRLIAAGGLAAVRAIPGEGLLRAQVVLGPAGASCLWRWSGPRDTLHIYLDPGLVTRVAAEAFDLEPARLTVPPLGGLDLPHLRAAMWAVDAELSAGCAGSLPTACRTGRGASCAKSCSSTRTAFCSSSRCVCCSLSDS